MKLTSKDILVMQMVHANKSIPEMASAMRLRSYGGVARRLTKLQDAGLVNPPPKPKMARSRSLTKLGMEVVIKYGAIKTETTEATHAE